LYFSLLYVLWYAIPDAEALSEYATVLSALFSGLAFAAFLYAIKLQQDELRKTIQLQNQMIRQNAIEILIRLKEDELKIISPDEKAQVISEIKEYYKELDEYVAEGIGKK
jgi:EAL domain-containing protein (putative c-di-GMP-specific phosphodiesterase class I)